jgi:hypothetical protein
MLLIKTYLWGKVQIVLSFKNLRPLKQQHVLSASWQKSQEICYNTTRFTSLLSPIWLLYFEHSTEGDEQMKDKKIKLLHQPWLTNTVDLPYPIADSFSLTLTPSSGRTNLLPRLLYCDTLNYERHPFLTVHIGWDTLHHVFLTIMTPHKLSCLRELILIRSSCCQFSGRCVGLRMCTCRDGQSHIDRVGPP